MRPEEISSSFEFTRGGFKISGASLEKMAAEVGTPLYVYDSSTIREKWQLLRANLPAEVDIFYSMKANPSMAVVDFIHKLGSGIEIASHGEEYLCERLDVKPRNIVFAGPAKTKVDLEAAIKYSIYSINAESVSEIKRIDQIAHNLGKRANVSLRINPNWEISGTDIKMGGPTQFGIPQEEFEHAAKALLSSLNIDPVGIHIFAGTNINNQQSFITNVEKGFEFAEEVGKKYSNLSHMFDFGGGLSIRYKDEDNALQLNGIGRKVDRLIEKYHLDRNNTRLIIEPGRYITGESGIFVSRVVEVKKSRDKTYLIMDGGINNLIRPAFIKAPHPIFNLSRESEDLAYYDVVGPLCTPKDFLGEDVRLPKDTQEGDLIGVFNAGAYGFTESMPLFLSHAIPAEVMVMNGDYYIARSRAEPEDFLSNQRHLLEK